MAGIKGRSGRQRGDPILTDALRVALKEEHEVCKETGKPTRKLHALAKKLVEKGLEGDVQAIREIWDRMEGKPQQAIELSADPDSPLTALFGAIDGASRGLPDQPKPNGKDRSVH